MAIRSVAVTTTCNLSSLDRFFSPNVAHLHRSNSTEHNFDHGTRALICCPWPRSLFKIEKNNVCLDFASLSKLAKFLKKQVGAFLFPLKRPNPDMTADCARNRCKKEKEENENMQKDQSSQKGCKNGE